MPKQRYDRRLVTILAIVFAQLLGASMILPILSLYAINELGVAETQVPLIQASFFIAQFVAAPYLGKLSDRFGRVPVLLVSQIGTVISYLMIAFAPSISVVYASRILDGITGGNIIVAQAYIIDITPRERRTQAIGMIFAVFGLGFIFGPSLGGALAAATSREFTFFTAAIVTTIPTIMTYFTLKETLTAEERIANRARGGQASLASMLRNRTIRSILAISVAASLGMGIVQSTFAVYGQNVLFAGQSEEGVNLGVGLMLGAVGLGQTVTQIFVLRRLLKRFGDAPLVAGGTVIRSLSMLWYFVVGLPFVTALFGQSALGLVAVPAALSFALGSGIMMPPLQSLATHAAPDNARGAVVGLTGSAQSLGVIIGTLIASPLLSIVVAGRPTLGPYLFNTILFAVMLIPAIGLVRRFGVGPRETAAAAAPPQPAEATVSVGD
ncbi:MAG: MFS transporter [Chloroflexi bacterium]|nr:MFS transporter [Chloroflexota bacterium]